MLSYLANSIWPETKIQMGVHQAARFSVKPTCSHELVIMQIGRYLCHNVKRGIIYNVGKSKGLEVYKNTGFSGGWSIADSDNADNALSQTGFVICMQPVLLYDVASFRQKPHFLPQRLSILTCSCPSRDYPDSKSHWRDPLCFCFAKSNDWLLHHSPQRQFICNCYSRIFVIHPLHKAHSHQISSLLQQSQYILQQIRCCQDQIHINQETDCWHIH